MTSSGVPDNPRSARVLLKDFVNVRQLLHSLPVKGERKGTLVVMRYGSILICLRAFFDHRI